MEIQGRRFGAGQEPGKSHRQQIVQLSPPLAGQGEQAHMLSRKIPRMTSVLLVPLLLTPAAASLALCWMAAAIISVHCLTPSSGVEGPTSMSRDAGATAAAAAAAAGGVVATGACLGAGCMDRALLAWARIGDPGLACWAPGAAVAAAASLLCCVCLDEAARVGVGAWEVEARMLVTMQGGRTGPCASSLALRMLLLLPSSDPRACWRAHRAGEARVARG